MTHLAIAISKPEDIEYIIKFKRRWNEDVVLGMLQDAKAKLLAFRLVGKITGDEFRTITHKIAVAHQETVNGQHQN